MRYFDIMDIIKYPDDYIWDEGVEPATIAWAYGLWRNKFINDEGIYIGKVLSV